MNRPSMRTLAADVFLLSTGSRVLAFCGPCLPQNARAAEGRCLAPAGRNSVRRLGGSLSARPGLITPAITLLRSWGADLRIEHADFFPF